MRCMLNLDNVELYNKKKSFKINNKLRVEENFTKYYNAIWGDIESQGNKDSENSGSLPD